MRERATMISASTVVVMAALCTSADDVQCNIAWGARAFSDNAAPMQSGSIAVLHEDSPGDSKLEADCLLQSNKGQRVRARRKDVTVILDVKDLANRRPALKMADWTRMTLSGSGLMTRPAVE